MGDSPFSPLILPGIAQMTNSNYPLNIWYKTCKWLLNLDTSCEHKTFFVHSALNKITWILVSSSEIPEPGKTYTGHTQKNGAVSNQQSPKHHSFVYALYYVIRYCFQSFYCKSMMFVNSSLQAQRLSTWRSRAKAYEPFSHIHWKPFWKHKFVLYVQMKGPPQTQQI
jgi:hypothetical protein